MKELIANQSTTIPFQGNLSLPSSIVSQKLWVQLITDYNGGFYFNNSIHLFGRSTRLPHHDILHMNDLVKAHFKHLFAGIAVGEDVFGNLFVFESDKWYLFMLESAEKELLAGSFAELIDVILNDVDYYTGGDLLRGLPTTQQTELTNGKRLAPKIPFILGGDYSQANLSLKDFAENIGFNASLAHQVANLEDGTKFSLKMK